jgi:hypothetical protein
MVADRSAGGSFSAPREVASGEDPSYAMAGDGTITVGGPRATLATSLNGNLLMLRRPDAAGHLITQTRAGSGPLGPVEDLRADCLPNADRFWTAIGDDGTAAVLLDRDGRVELFVDAPADSPGAQECVDDDTVYGRPPRAQPPHPPAPPTTPPVYAPGPLTIGLDGVKVARSSRSRAVTLDLKCNRKCSLDGSASLRLSGGGVLSRAVASKTTSSSGRAGLRLTMRLSRHARRLIAATDKPLRIEVRIVATDLALPGHPRTVRKVSRKVR